MADCSDLHEHGRLGKCELLRGNWGLTSLGPPHYRLLKAQVYMGSWWCSQLPRLQENNEHGIYGDITFTGTCQFSRVIYGDITLSGTRQFSRREVS